MNVWDLETGRSKVANASLLVTFRFFHRARYLIPYDLIVLFCKFHSLLEYIKLQRRQLSDLCILHAAHICLTCALLPGTINHPFRWHIKVSRADFFVLEKTAIIP